MYTVHNILHPCITLSNVLQSLNIDVIYWWQFSFPRKKYEHYYTYTAQILYMISFALYFSLLYLGHYSMRGFGAKIGRELQHAGGLRNARIAFKGSILFSPRSYWVCLLALLKCAVSLLKRRKTTPPDVRNSRHVYQSIQWHIMSIIRTVYIYSSYSWE